MNLSAASSIATGLLHGCGRALCSGCWNWFMYVSDASITVTIMLEKKQNVEVMLLLSISMGSSGESIKEAISFHCLPPWGSCVTARVELQLAFGQNFPGKYFPAIFFWAYTDVISQWIPICQNVLVNSRADSVCPVGLGFGNGLVICWLLTLGLFIGLV